MIKQFGVILLLFCSLRAHAGDSTGVTDGFRTKPGFGTEKIIATTAVGGLIVTSLIWSYDTWWRDAGREFNFREENWLNSYTKGVDKLGHFYTSYFYFHTFRNVMLWGGYESSVSTVWAAASAAFFAVAIEVGDGITPQYGFDYQDMLFNFAGVGFGILQTEFPFLRNFNFKWSFVPNDGYKFPIRFTDFYEAHTYWLAFNVNNLLPESLEPYWPDFLQVAIGGGIDDTWTKRELVLGFDFNLESIFNPSSEDMTLLTRTLDMFHLPLPAVKLTETETPRYYLIHRN